MTILLKAFKKTVGLSKVKKASVLPVRELEEESKNHWICFVDEAAESYDVHFEIDSKQNALVETKCDCGVAAETLCLHKIAAICQYLQSDESEVNKRKKAVAKAPFVSILQNLDENELKSWVSELLTNNKDLQLLFTNHFVPQRITYSPTEIESLTKKAIYSVINKKRKTVTAVELKKIVTLWWQIHEPILQMVSKDITSQEYFSWVKAIVDTCAYFNWDIYKASNKIDKYIESIWELMADVMIKETLDRFELAVSFYLANTIDKKGIHLHYINFLQTVFDKADASKQKALALAAKDFLIKNPDFRDGEITPFLQLLLDFLVATDLLTTYSNICQPSIYQNEYNIALLNDLIDAELYEKAEVYCVEIIRHNRKEIYNFVYWNLLKIIYQRTTNKVVFH